MKTVPAIMALAASVIGIDLAKGPDRSVVLCNRCKGEMILSKKVDPTEDDLYMCDNFFCGLEDLFYAEK